MAALIDPPAAGGVVIPNFVPLYLSTILGYINHND
jgi:hypothetical protein